MTKISLYVFSGLCADERMFQHLQFPEFVDVHFIRWENPLKNETLDQYIDRLLGKLDFSKPIVLLGLSFGGMVAQEIANKIKVEHTIIISSVSHPTELPWYFKLTGRLYLYKIIPFRLLKWANSLARKIFGATTDESKNLLKSYSNESNTLLLKWSIKQILSWRRKKTIENLFHIHGSNDQLLPLKNKSVGAIIKDGGHFMIVEQANEVEIVLNEQLLKIKTSVEKKKINS